MPLDTPNVEQSIHALLSRPAVYIDADHIDTNRALAAGDLSRLDYGVFVQSRPTGSNPLAVTIESSGGVSQPSLDYQPDTDQRLVDLTIWVRADQGRVNRAEHHRFGELIKVYLLGLRGLVGTQEIGDIVLETEPFQNDEPPDDGSDDWHQGYTYGYLVFCRGARASHRIAKINPG